MKQKDFIEKIRQLNDLEFKNTINEFEIDSMFFKELFKKRYKKVLVRNKIIQEIYQKFKDIIFEQYKELIIKNKI